MYETQEWEMGCAVTTLGVTAVSKQILINFSLLHTPRMHMSIIYAWNIMVQNNNIAVQVVAHVSTLLAMSVRLHVRRQYSHAIALP
jgi:hypothetical protein